MNPHPTSTLSTEDNLSRLRNVLTLLNMALFELPKGEGAAMAAGLEHAHDLPNTESNELTRLRDVLNTGLPILP